MRSIAELQNLIACLTPMPRPALIARWQALYRRSPPKGISRNLLVRAIAYELQVQQYGGLKPTTRRRLRSITKSSALHASPVSAQSIRLRSGTRLVRDWNGSTYVVEVTDSGFIWNGVQYRSLSAIARAITGARWSGPRFFGLTSGGAP